MASDRIPSNSLWKILHFKYVLYLFYRILNLLKNYRKIFSKILELHNINLWVTLVELAYIHRNNNLESQKWKILLYNPVAAHILKKKFTSSTKIKKGGKKIEEKIPF